MSHVGPDFALRVIDCFEVFPAADPNMRFLMFSLFDAVIVLYQLPWSVFCYMSERLQECVFQICASTFRGKHFNTSNYQYVPLYH